MTAPDTIAEIPLEQLHESPFNPRRTFTGIDELAANIKAEGRIHEPLLVRPRLVNILRPDGEIDGYEIVFGHRRLRAAEAAGLATAPCMVRAMTNAQARSAQISENLQRHDVHPIEEAEGLRALIDAGDATADELAERLGKSRSHIYSRLKLLQACPEVRTACLEGRVGAEVALLIARLRTDKLQAKALQYIRARNLSAEDGGKQSFRRIRDNLAEHFNTALKGALFDPEDATLLPAAGACSACPKRAGNAPEFADIAGSKDHSHWQRERYGANVCTDPDCFAAKKAAHLARQAAALKAAGKTVIAGAKARAAIGADGTVKGAYVPVAQGKQALAAATPKKGRGGGVIAAPAAAPAPQKVVIQDPRSGKTVEAYRREDLVAAGVKDAAEKPKKGDYAARDAAHEAKLEAARKAAEQALRDERARRIALLQRVREAMQGRPRDAFDLQLAARAALAGVEWRDRQNLATLHGQEDMHRLFDEKWLARQDAATLTQLIMDCALVGQCNPASWSMDKPPALLLRVAAHYGVDASAAGMGAEAAACAAEETSAATS